MNFFFRLHRRSEINLLNVTKQDTKIRRTRRHQLRKVLIALDYVVECLGSTLIFVVIFIADESLLQQHVLLTFGSFVYGVPIPFAYLLNETRVRNIIINTGWIEGLKSIFYSPEKIKELERKRIVNYLHPQATPLHQCDDLVKVSNGNIMSKIKSTDDLRENDLNTGRSENELLLYNNMQETFELSYLPTYNPKKDGHSTPEHSTDYNKENANPTIAHCTIENNAFEDESSGSLGETPKDVKYSMNESDRMKGGIDSDSDDSIIVPLYSNLDEIKVVDVEPKFLMCKDTSFIEVAFSEQSNIILDLLSDKKFRSFSRTYVLRNILKLLTRNKTKESDYRKYFEHLCCLESFPQAQNDTDAKLNFIISLINAWYLSKHKINLKHKTSENDFQKKNKQTVIDVSVPNKERIIDRIRIINLMLESIFCDEQYNMYLKELYELEDEQDEEELVYGW